MSVLTLVQVDDLWNLCQALAIIFDILHSTWQTAELKKIYIIDESINFYLTTVCK